MTYNPHSQKQYQENSGKQHTAPHYSNTSTQKVGKCQIIHV